MQLFIINKYMMVMFFSFFFPPEATNHASQLLRYVEHC